MSRAPVPLPQGKARPTRDGRVRRSRAACENFQPSLRRRAGRTPLERSFARPPEREHSNRSIRFPIRASRAILERSPLRRASARPSIPKGLWDGRWETKWNGRGGSAGIAPGRPRQMVLEARTGNRRERFAWSRDCGRADERSKMVPESRRSTFPDQAACVSGHLSSNGSAERTRSRSPCTRRGNPVRPGTRPLASDGRLPGRHSAALRSAARSRRPSRTRRSEAVQESPRPLEAARPLAPSPTHGESRASTRFLTAGTGSRSVPAAPATPRSRRRGARTDSPGAPDPSPRAAPADRTPAAHEAR